MVTSQTDLVDTHHGDDAEAFKTFVEGLGLGKPEYIISTHRHVEHIGDPSGKKLRTSRISLLPFITQFLRKLIRTHKKFIRAQMQAIIIRIIYS